jgi:hypothetical protein
MESNAGTIALLFELSFNHSWSDADDILGAGLLIYQTFKTWVNPTLVLKSHQPASWQPCPAIAVAHHHRESA